MELNLKYLIDIARALGKENLFIVASDQMPSDHSLWIADDFEKVAIERSLHDTVIELDNEHVLLVATEAFSDQLARLYLVIIVALLELDMLREPLLNLLASEVLFRRDHTDVPTENVESLLADIRVAIQLSTLMVLEPGVRLKTDKSTGLSRVPECICLDPFD